MKIGRGPTERGGASAEATEPPRPARSRRWLSPWWLGGVAVVLVVAALVAIDLRATSKPSTSKADVNGIVDKKVAAAVKNLESQPPASVTVYDAIRGPLVVIQTQQNGPGPPASRSGLGSGIIVNAQGDILTSLHVVQDAATIKVSFSDGSESPASVKSTDPDHDIAVLTPAKLPEVVVPAVLGGGARIGEEAFAVGHPLGLVGSLSAGVISGLNRSFPLSNGKTLSGMIQFDAAVNPGNSGGPLLNRAGQVIGIVTGLANPAGDDDFIGIGFAVPIGTAGGAAGAPGK
ncbi:MAG TPA: trypsin-like peptidase domain-containing protein [Acidimicrobiales bacterium]|jgi:S1-C subfamily serine protease|nr:trypsin-like peptidase domain-containing protein [Acidimicrobiales bacterium]